MGWLFKWDVARKFYYLFFWADIGDVKRDGLFLQPGLFVFDPVFIFHGWSPAKVEGDFSMQRPYQNKCSSSRGLEKCQVLVLKKVRENKAIFL